MRRSLACILELESLVAICSSKTAAENNTYHMYFNVYGGFGLHSRWVKKTYLKQVKTARVGHSIRERNLVRMSFPVTLPLAEGGPG